MQPTSTISFSERLLKWWSVHGRKELPWQTKPRSAYHIWIAEIMLQQTQVSTVIPYYQSFFKHFPDLYTLAISSVDDVLAQWSGLGYYQRARNLHRCAKICVAEHQSQLPMNAEALNHLPGIGPSTANAIVSQSTDKVLPILDGNVKRWLARYAGISGWPGKTAISKQLWQAAESLLPDTNGANYTQACMDLGAMVCHRNKPDCQNCPVRYDCFALHQNQIEQLPGKKPKRHVPSKTIHLLLQQKSDEVLLIQRPPTGIWGGLWCLPIFDEAPVNARFIGEFSHQLTHLHMRLHLWKKTFTAQTINEANQRWFTLENALQVGLPKPIRTIIEAL